MTVYSIFQFLILSRDVNEAYINIVRGTVKVKPDRVSRSDSLRSTSHISKMIKKV